MEEYGAYNAGSDHKKCAAVPPILIHSPCSTPSDSSHGATCILPPISPHTSIISGGQLPYQNHWNSNFKQTEVGLNDREQDRIAVKHERLNHVQVSSCMFSNTSSQSSVNSKNPPNNIHLLNQRLPSLPSHLSPLASSGNQHLQPPHNLYPTQAAQSPLISDLSPTHHSQKSSHFRMVPHFDSSNNPRPFGKIKSEVRAGAHRLPPLALSSYTSGSNLDIDDTLSPLVPPINSLSPYIGSGISEIPSFPSILASPAHLSRKRALSTSPLSDVFDVYALRSSPNSLLYNIPPNGPIPASNNGAVGHLIGQSNTAIQTMQYRVQQSKTSIECNKNDDGTTNTTIINQVTFSENPQAGTELMEMDHCNGLTLDIPHNIKNEDLVESHICLWEGCGLSFEDLDDLVQHIENAHVEKGKADEYVCLWQSCIRRKKPFNARYKLLIHMRIHSGEKPNRCTVSL